MKLNLTEYNLYEKYEWLLDMFGNEDAAHKVKEQLIYSEIAAQDLIEIFELTDEELHLDPDPIGFICESNSSTEIIEAWRNEYGDKVVEEAVDLAVRKFDLDDDLDSLPDGFDSYNDFCAWKNA